MFILPVRGQKVVSLLEYCGPLVCPQELSHPIKIKTFFGCRIHLRLWFRHQNWSTVHLGSTQDTFFNTEKKTGKIRPPIDHNGWKTEYTNYIIQKYWVLTRCPWFWCYSTPAQGQKLKLLFEIQILPKNLEPQCEIWILLCVRQPTFWCQVFYLPWNDWVKIKGIQISNEESKWGSIFSTKINGCLIKETISQLLTG